MRTGKNAFLISFLLFTFLSVNSFAQYVYKIKADSVLITNDSCNAELILMNSTKNVNGFLYNRGNGRTEFRRVKVNDSVYAFGNDTLKLYNQSGAYIQNQNTAAQPANFWVNGNGIINGMLGLGMTNPQYTLDVNGPIRFGILLAEPMANNGAMFYSSNNQFRGHRNGTWKNFAMEGDYLTSSGATHSGTLTMNSSPKITAPNTTLTIEATSSTGTIVIGASNTGSGTYIKKTGNEGRALVLWDEVAEPTQSTASQLSFGYKRTASYTSDLFPSFTGYYFGANISQTPSSNFGQYKDNSKSGYIDFYTLGRDGSMPVKWTKVSNGPWGGYSISVWKEYGNKTELYPDGEAGTNFTIGSKTINVNSLKTSGTAPATTGATKYVVTDANGLQSFSSLNVPLFTPSSSADPAGNDGDITRDASGHMFMKTGGQWYKFTGITF